MSQRPAPAAEKPSANHPALIAFVRALARTAAREDHERDTSKEGAA